SVSGRHRLPSPESGTCQSPDRQTDVSRGVSFVSRAENHYSAAPDIEIHSRIEVDRARRIYLVLWKRRHLQHHSTGDVEAVAFPETGPHCEIRRCNRSDSKPRLPPAN